MVVGEGLHQAATAAGARHRLGERRFELDEGHRIVDRVQRDHRHGDAPAGVGVGAECSHRLRVGA